MRIIFALSCFLFSFASYSQNWNVFNKNYRYNYKFDNSVLVTNVLFVDSVKQSGTDTIYTLNRIGVECTGSCPTITAALTPGMAYVVPNMPQFLQRCIRKYSNGIVKLYDTTKIVIIPTCTLNQTWLFDSVYNKSANCINTSTQIVFGNIDSVKTILIDNIDTLKLSKSFGIILFPDPYAKNKYYRLSGIEKRNSYDLTALFGEKVPNAWDFYNYDVGDVFCTSQWQNSVFNQPSSCNKYKTSIMSKSISIQGIIYNSETYSQNTSFNNYVSSPCNGPPEIYNTSYSVGASTLSAISLSNPTLTANVFYPNMIYHKAYNLNIDNIVKYGKDDLGRFYKYCGQPCSLNQPPLLPNTNAITGCTLNVNGLYETFNDYETNAVSFGVGFGQLTNNYVGFETLKMFCLTSFVKNNVIYFGNPNPIGLTEINKSNPNSLFYPNPSQNEISIEIKEPTQIIILNLLGQIMFNSIISKNDKIDVRHFENGLYLVYLSNANLKVSQKLLIQH